jgi:hypothetical protein
MFSCLFNWKPRDYYIEERNYDSEKILIDNNRLKLVCDGKIVVESGASLNPSSMPDFSQLIPGDL